MDGFSVYVDSEEFGRIMTNALAFFPARSPVDYAHLAFTPQRITAIGTDTYTVGRDWCEAERWNSAGPALVRVDLDREGWQAVEKSARMDRGNHGRLEYRPGDCLTFYPGGEKSEVAVAQDMTGRTWAVRIQDCEGVAFWDLCNYLLTQYDDAPTETPGELLFDPALFGRFQKIKVSKSAKGEKVLAFFYQGNDAPMLAKIGPTFVGLIMPLSRDKYLGNPENGGESLW